MIGNGSVQEVQRQIDILVRACNGLKFDEIKAKLPRSCYRPDLDDIIRRMILDGKLSEVEFYNPATKSSAKSFILPGGVAIRLNTGDSAG